MDEILEISSDNVIHYRHVHVAAHIITTEKLNHCFALNFADLDMDKLPLLLTGDAVASELAQRGSNSRFLRRGEGLLSVTTNEVSRSLSVRGFFHTEQEARTLRDELVKAIPQPQPPADKVAMNFWSWGGPQEGPERSVRRITVPSWSEVNGNYAEGVTSRLGELMVIKPKSDLSGKLVLWRGAPGVGKTWALRALCREWRQWCAVHYIIDPDIFFTTASYMIGVMTSMVSNTPGLAGHLAADDDDEAPIRQSNSQKWNLLILEDAGELVAIDSKARTGQALSKLLNLSDGLLGQGVNLIVLITTNEDYDALHPAISRQGRCLSNLAFDPFSEAEAETWLKTHNCNERPLKGKRTLADLYAHLTDRETIQNEAARKAAGFSVTR